MNSIRRDNPVHYKSPEGDLSGGSGFVDTHCHVTDSKFDADRDAVIGRAQDAGVTTLVEIAESPDTWATAVALTEKYPFIYASLGIHPHHAHHAGPGEWPSLSRKLRELLKRPKVVAVGEFGLDYFRMENSTEQQDYLFRQQLDLAKETGKPIVIHCRDAHGDTQKRLKEYYPDASYARSCIQPHGTIHCFSGTWEDAQTYLTHGFVLGIDGPVTYPNSKVLKENVTRLPLERMILETDSPYLPPQTHRGERNEPAYIPVIAEAIAELKHKATSDVARQTTANARALFRL
jgi:TatD DNase family protein